MRYPSRKLLHNVPLGLICLTTRSRWASNNHYTLADPSACWNQRRPSFRAARTIQNTRARSQRRYTFYRRAHLRVMATGKDTSRQCQDGNDRHRRYSRSRALPGKKCADERLALITHRSVGNILAPVIIGCRARWNSERWRSPACFFLSLVLR